MDFSVTGTHIWYYYICKREVWLLIHGLEADQENENMKIGKLIGETSYKREKKEIDLGNAKLDILRTEDGEIIIGEVKKSSRFIDSASKQLLFYLLQLHDMGIQARGELLIPEEKKKIDIVLNDSSRNEIINAVQDIERIANTPIPPVMERNKYCRKCAYSEFCWA